MIVVCVVCDRRDAAARMTRVGYLQWAHYWHASSLPATNGGTMTDAEYERIVDRAVQNRLQRSNRYRYAATAEEQAQVEAEITAAVEADYARRAGNAA